MIGEAESGAAVSGAFTVNAWCAELALFAFVCLDPAWAELWLSAFLLARPTEPAERVKLKAFQSGGRHHAAAAARTVVAAPGAASLN
jgi:hypothetical protein